MNQTAYAYWTKQLTTMKSKAPVFQRLVVEKNSQYILEELVFQSVDHSEIYGKIWINQNPNHKLIILFHGLGAHTSTDGYLSIANRYVNYGFHVFGFDVRLQGGKTIDVTPYRFLEYGLYAGNIDILDHYYYVKVYQDALMLFHIIDQIKEIRHCEWIATGGSQGGALALFVSSLISKIEACVVDIPSCCDIPYLIEHSTGGFHKLNQLFMDHPYLKDSILQHLSIIDLQHLTQFITCKVLASVGGQDMICPPKSFEKAYHQIQTKKELITYEDYGHGGYDLLHFPKKLAFMIDSEE